MGEQEHNSFKLCLILKQETVQEEINASIPNETTQTGRGSLPPIKDNFRHRFSKKSRGNVRAGHLPFPCDIERPLFTIDARELKATGFSISAPLPL